MGEATRRVLHGSLARCQLRRTDSPVSAAATTLILVVLERLSALIWACFGLHFGGLGRPSWGQVGASWAKLGPS